MKKVMPLILMLAMLPLFGCFQHTLTIGTGGSVGREGPIVQIGSTIGSTVGQITKMSDDRVRNLVACGAAGGVAATFNAPIAGVFFALEVILGDFGVRSFGTVVLASVTASAVGRAAFGDVLSSWEIGYGRRSSENRRWTPQIVRIATDGEGRRAYWGRSRTSRLRRV